MNESKATKIKYLRYVLIAVFIVLLLSSVVMLINAWEKRHGTYTKEDSNNISTTINYEGESYSINKNVQAFLVIGVDKFEKDVDNSSYNTDMNADYVVLYVLDNENKKCTALQISRDTMVDINKLGLGGVKVGTYNGQLSLSYSEGTGGKISCRNTADAVSALLGGVRISHYASVTMDTVATLNDLVGGVELTVLDSFSGIDSTLVKGETVLLNGEQALKYIRSRQGMDDSTNNNRMNRQKQYLGALAEKLKGRAAEDEKFVFNAIEKINSCLVSDCSVNQLEELAEKLTGYETEIRILEGKSVMGEQYMEFYPDKKQLKKTVVELFYTKDN